ncbi:MFS transporter [Streptomyces bathyalis]|uniref:MFS transporter n=1 Tax=Streptomyces bathyalis TaxID=2710756 RepID=A0A7T1T7T2_9ACTN|nr:MFS transporter [Streptomyces bathyalis]QPP07970.1 MFS transporter [Streptomyces bathyalis]
MARSLENVRPSRTHWLITMYAGGGEFCDGFILSIIGVALPLITVSFGMDSTQAGLLGAAALIGMVFGGLIFGYVTDKIGRQKVYLADLAAFVVLSVLQFFATDPWQLIVLRFAMGIAIGADFAIAGTIASEFAPQKSRGPLMVVVVTMWSLGAATAYGVGWAMLSLGPEGWRWMLASSAVPAALILLLRIGTPESPRWLLKKGRTDEAKAVLTQMLGPDADLADVAEDPGVTVRYLDVFRGPYLRRTIFVALFWACQLLPLYAINTYEPAILGSFGLSHGSGTYVGSMVIQIFFVLGSLSGMLMVNRGRRPLLLWSFGISAIPLLVLSLLSSPPAMLVIVLFAVYAVASMSSQCMQVLYPSELFPTGVRATANGVATAFSRVGAMIGTYGAPILLAYSTSAAMFVGAGIAILGCITSFFLAPETNGMTLNEASASVHHPRTGRSPAESPAMLEETQ